ncbi:hypothetical protein psal_cds_859 [Pandoravirus salinus]|uniref:Uncharacterized protein n=1 Tax=Pandoravirus salinus TaxID=1349410 RepID=A0A291ATM3_9VIRU|nr:hypothetical protein psal_cds_859 [Pandoravirus salinus]ATE82242.1 hypothetical protein psal_cds_859 [Pandoravirus salinus]
MSKRTNKPTGVLTGKMITDMDGDEHYVVGFRFRYKSGDGVGVRFAIDPTTTEPAQWTALVDAIKANQKCHVTTCSSNGDVSVYHDDGQIMMSTQKAGAGGDGDLDVTLPAAKCLEAIEKCAAAYAAHDPSLGGSS